MLKCDILKCGNTINFLRINLGNKRVETVLIKCGNTTNFLRINLGNKRVETVLILSPYIFPT